MNSTGIAGYLKHQEHIKEAKRICAELEEYGYVMASFTVEDYQLNTHEVTVYELDKRQFWVHKFADEVVEFRELT